MDEIVQYLTGIPAWYLATIDAADPTQPRVRPFSFAAQADGKLWFSTSRDKDVWRELEANAKFELSGWKPGECWIGRRSRTRRRRSMPRRSSSSGLRTHGRHRRAPRFAQRRPSRVFQREERHVPHLRHRRQRAKVSVLGHAPTRCFARLQPARPPHTSLQPHVNQPLLPIARGGDRFVPRANASPPHHFSFNLVPFIFVKSRLNWASGIMYFHGYNN